MAKEKAPEDDAVGLGDFTEESAARIGDPIEDEEYDYSPFDPIYSSLPGGGDRETSRLQRELDEALERAWEEEDRAYQDGPQIRFARPLTSEGETIRNPGSKPRVSKRSGMR